MSRISITMLFLATLCFHALDFHAQASRMLPAEFTTHTESNFSLQTGSPRFNHTGFKHNINIMPNANRRNTPFISLGTGLHLAHTMNINARERQTQLQPSATNTHSAPWLMLTGLLSLSLISRRKHTPTQAGDKEKQLTHLEKTFFHTPNDSIWLPTFDPNHFPCQNPPVSNNHHSDFEFKRNMSA